MKAKVWNSVKQWIIEKLKDEPKDLDYYHCPDCGGELHYTDHDFDSLMEGAVVFELWCNQCETAYNYYFAKPSVYRINSYNSQLETVEMKRRQQ